MTRVLLLTEGAAGLAKIVGSSRQAVHKWKRIPAEHIEKVSAAIGIPKEDLRPDLDMSTQG